MKNTYRLMISGLVLATALPATVMADHLTPDQALARLKASRKAMMASRIDVNSLKLEKQLPEIYIFSRGEGYAVLPADDAAYPLLGYSDTGKFSDNPELAYWLDTYSRQIEYYKGLSYAPAKVTRAAKAPISPLTQTLWNQEAPYNDDCPIMNGQRCVTGCVATAMAQEMKYFNYPPTGTGTHTYYWQSGADSLSFNYGATTFDWDAMTDTYDSSSTTEAKNAVATLMLAAGISVDMEYTDVESGAVSRNMGTALINNFGYDKSLWMPERDYYGLTDWEDMVYSELERGCPVLYGGQGSAGGHQFICDGYSSDGYFHFNWGWGGLSNGYFLLTALDPPALGTGGGAGGFNFDQSIVMGLKLPEEGSDYTYVIYWGNSIGTQSTTASVNTQVYFTGGFYNMSFATLPANSNIGIEITSSSGATQYLTSWDIEGLKVNYGSSQLPVNWPSLADGTYECRPVYRVNGGAWQPVTVPVGVSPYVLATVEAGTTTFTTPEAYSLSVTDVQLNSDLYSGLDFSLSFTVTNAGPDEYVGSVVAVLYDASTGEMAGRCDSYPVDIVAGDSASVNVISSFSAITTQTSATSDTSSAVAAGNYNLGVVDGTTGKLVSATTPVTVKEAPANTEITVSNLATVGSSDLTTEDSSAEFSFKVNCTEGYFDSSLTLAVFASTGGSSLTTAHTDQLFISAGQSENAVVKVDISTLGAGQYMAAVFNGSTQMTNGVGFTITDASTGVEDVAISQDAVRYDLSGRRLQSAPHHGIYIVNGKKVAVTE